MTKKFIIITSIFEPTEAVKKFSKIQDFKMIVVGDKKSPAKYECENVEFLSWDKELPFSLAKKLPFNHYCRKMLGYLWAMQQGAQIIYDTDDDNLPLENWNLPEFSTNYDLTAKNEGFLNVYNYYTEQKIWPRGFPLPKIVENKKVLKQTNENINVGIWQGLADGDPDVDAIYRLTDNTPCYFDKEKPPIIFNEGTICPFNSQNTAFKKELFALLYLPSTVTFRYTDILRGLVAQPVLWAAGYKLGFTTATVFQDRNIHNYLKDFESEIPCYLFADKVIELANNSVKPSNTIAENLFKVYEALQKENIVKQEELEILSAWLKDVSGS